MKTASAILFAALFLTPAAARAQPVETELAGVTAELVELRQSGGVLRLAVRFANAAAETANFNGYEVSRIVLVDAKSKKKHFPIQDANGLWVAGPIGDDIAGGRIVLKIPPRQTTVVWAYFEPVTAGTVMHVEVPHVFPFENVPVTEGPGKAFASRTARTTPGGGLATIVSAKRGDQVLNVRLRLTAEKEEAQLLDAYLRFKHVFLFDPIAKRKYPLVKDSEGDFQGQPIHVNGDGGSFIFDWRKTILVSLTFQAPPDTVQRADLLLPQFLPFEGLAIEGLGGAAAGGTEAAGKTLDLKGAMKELKAEETATEIKIDLAADVLFDFDKAEIKNQAGPTLQNLATVLKANPGAKVAIEGHTDGRGADAYNQTLSEQRAASVKQWLVANAQVDGAAIATRGWGKTKPVAHNTKPDGTDDAEGRAKNRRVEIVVRKGGQGGDEPLLALLPKRIAGTDLRTQSTPSGGQSLNAGSEEWRNYLASLRKTNADVSRATAVAPPGAALEFQMSAFRVAGLDWGPRLETFQANVAAASRGGVRFEQVALGGKNVRRAINRDKISVAPIYYYAAGDILFYVQSLNEAAVAEALSLLPAGPPAGTTTGAAASAPSAAAGQPGARPVFELGMSEVACVGRPAILMTKLLDATGVPIPFVTITQIASLGTLTPFEQGPGNNFEAEYLARRWGSGVPGREGKEDFVITANYPGGTHSTIAHIDVALCLGGDWQDGPRAIEIDHIGSVVTARIISGTSSECQQSGYDFSGILIGNKLTGQDLQVCNPKGCVPATDLALYEATVADDAMSIDFTWTRKVGQGCNLTSTVQERFSITRTGPVGRFGT